MAASHVVVCVLPFIWTMFSLDYALAAVQQCVQLLVVLLGLHMAQLIFWVMCHPGIRVMNWYSNRAGPGAIVVHVNLATMPCPSFVS